ncbi:hypothetical protein WN943_013083 [Citrus x changshan-huyou]
MAVEKTSDKPECAQQALDLLNCVTQSSFDQDKCLHLLNALRECVVSKLLDDPGVEDSKLSEAAALRYLCFFESLEHLNHCMIRMFTGLHHGGYIYKHSCKAVNMPLKVKKFSLAEQGQQEASPISKEA